MFKPGQSVSVSDPTSPYFGKIGTIVSTATNPEYMAVSVRFVAGEATVWLFSTQLK